MGKGKAENGDEAKEKYEAERRRERAKEDKKDKEKIR